MQSLYKSAIAFEKSILIAFSSLIQIYWYNTEIVVIVLCGLDLFCLYESCLVFLSFVPKEIQSHGINK